MASTTSKERAWWHCLYWFPISCTNQCIASQVISEALIGGLGLSDALELAALASPSFRLRHALRAMRGDVRAGYSLDVSLRRSGARVSPGFATAFRIGEAHGRLAEELSAFTRSMWKEPERELCRKLGRSSQAVQLATVLARLLMDRSLTVSLLEAAGQLAAPGDRGFRRVIQDMITTMKQGEPLVNSLNRHPQHFDLVFRRLVESAQTREQMRSTLARLGESCTGAHAPVTTGSSARSRFVE